MSTDAADKTDKSAVTGPVNTNPSSLLVRVPWQPPVAVSAKGIYIDLATGQRLIDGVGGAAVACIGNGHPKVVKAIKDQVDKVAYVYSMQLTSEPAEALAQKLVDTSKGAFTCAGLVSGGSEAMEGVIKLARQYYLELSQPQRTNFIARKLSFHGNTLGTLSLAHHPARRGPYACLLEDTHFHHVGPAYAKRFQRADEDEEAYVERLRKELEDKFEELGGDTVIGFVAETVVGATTGVVPPPKGYFKAMKSVCDKYGALLILDEVMSGMGRIGTLHAWETYGDGVRPDIQAVAKGLGGGYATIGAVLLSEKVTSAIQANSGFWKHGHTYQNHPLACAASLAVQRVIEEENLLENINKQGELLEKLLQEGLRGPNALAVQNVFDIRGRGAWWAVEFDFWSPSPSTGPAKFAFPEPFAMLVQSQALQNGLIVMAMTGGSNVEGTKGDHLMLSPAYNTTEEETRKIAELFLKSVKDVLERYRV